MWADEALDAKKSKGNILFNPQNPAVWPRELITAYDAAALFANHSSVGQSEGNGDNEGLKEDQRPGMTRVH
ncbi:hypothetical protein STCU_12030 [Strigomonas culicis]|uniref:Uncharacterized protein n=1 Tax=Strigomonas culicis TaxID=28005 RepID=S9UL65_9TRYP|nr:hypothetical protein STCU_12030 [Strigomonas culicis]|eukprot:EPY15431.1 hypothetical protein STCU_12030 [Strigomonas culicis]